jgi:hypothetical protein
MTTPDPALAAALDRLIAAVRESMAVHYLDDQATEAQQAAARQEREAARAAVFACAAPAMARVEALEAVAEAARQASYAFGHSPSHTQLWHNDQLQEAIKALDGEPEDAGA